MKRISLILAAIAVCIGFSFSPLLVSAEESAVISDISIKRQAWRDEINALEKELSEVATYEKE